MKTPWVSGLGLLIFPPLVMAHPGHDMAGAYAGFMHPLAGWDHLLAMLAIGLWAGRLGGNARWQLPLAFMVVMLVGALAGMAGMALPGLETGMAASVLAVGLLVALRAVPGKAWQIGLTALFAWLHGLAHGVELAAYDGAAVMLGMLAATGVLHVAGLLLASGHQQWARWAHRGFGGLLVLAGGYLLIA